MKFWLMISKFLQTDGETPYFFHPQEIEEIFQILNKQFQTNENRISNLKSLILE
jgi:hypothetical protein